MSIKHFDRGDGAAACGATGCYISTTVGVSLVECARCERSKAFKSALAEKELASKATVADILNSWKKL